MAAKGRKSGKKQKKSVKLGRVLLLIAAILTLSATISFYWFYKRVFAVNLRLDGNKKEFVYIRTGSDINDVVNALTESGWLIDKSSFIWLSEFMKYDERILPGRYQLEGSMSNLDLVRQLRSGKQVPVNLTFRSMRTKEQLAGRVGRILEADSLSLINLMNDSGFMRQFGLNPEQALCLFLPDTYEFYWNTDASTFIRKMAEQYNAFWTEDRLKKAESAGLSKTDVQILASIIVQESNMRDEWPVIAGVYINRLKIGLPLQADPTVKFALGDFELKRVRKYHTTVDSPYNTYKYKGLPPGPIYMAGKQSMDAVLNYQRHNYLYFCARPDRSGYHTFTKSYTEHLRVAGKYHRSLNARGI
ncbi:MAG: endolytic transglycosylase MltG [Bacteroidetes bacterium]|nr:endolytic transglycosylase MltG [Bacteroidota bacterium]